MPRKPFTDHIDSPEAVGQRLREAREAAGLSQKEISFPGCNPAYVSRIESGTRVASLHVLAALAERVKVDVSWLAKGIKPETKQEPDWDDVFPLEIPNAPGQLWLSLRLFGDDRPAAGEKLSLLSAAIRELWQNEDTQAKAARLTPENRGLDNGEDEIIASMALPPYRLEVIINSEVEDQAIAELRAAFAARKLLGPLASLFYGHFCQQVWSEKLQVVREEAEARHRQTGFALDNLPKE